MIFKDSVNFFMLSTGFLMQGQIFADSHRHCAMREGGENGTFSVKRASDEKFCPSTYDTVRGRIYSHNITHSGQGSYMSLLSCFALYIEHVRLCWL